MTTAAVDWTTAFAPGFDGVTCVLIEGVPRLYCESGVEPDAVAVTSGSLDPLFHFPVGALTVTRPDFTTFNPVRAWLADQTWTVRETTQPVDGTVEVEPVRFEFYDADGAATELLSAPRSRVARLLAADVNATANVPLDSAVSVPSTGYGHIGRETIGWGAVSTATLDVSYLHGGRGLFGSHARPHVAGEGTRRPAVTMGELPRYITGRRVVVFLARLSGTTLYDPTPVAISVVGAGVALSAGLMRYQIPGDSLLSLLDHKLAKVSVRAFGFQHTGIIPSTSPLVVNFQSESLYLEPTENDGWSPDAATFAFHMNTKGAALATPINVGFTGGRFRITATGPGGEVSWSIATPWADPRERTGTSENLGENTAIVPACVMSMDSYFSVKRDGDWDRLPATISWTAAVDGVNGGASAALTGETVSGKLTALIAERDATNRRFLLFAGFLGGDSLITKPTDLTLSLIAEGPTALAAIRALLTASDELSGNGGAADALVDWERISETFARANPGAIPSARRYVVTGDEDSLLAPLIHECRLRGAALCIRKGRLAAYRPGYFAATEGVRRDIVEGDVLAGIVPEVMDGIEPVVTAIRFSLPDGGSYTWRDTTAAEDFGEGKLVECDALKWATGITTPGAFSDVLQRNAQQLLGVLAAPTRVVRIVVGPSFWSLDAGDLVTLTHSELPDLHGNRGLSECMAQVMEKRMAWGGGQCRVQLALLISDDTTIAGYAPSALVGSISGAVVTLDTTSPWGTNCFGRDTDANGAAYTSPLQGFAVGMRVQLSQLDDETPMADEFFTVVSLTSTTLTLSGSPTAPMVSAASIRYGCLLRYAPWTDAAVTTDQRQYLYIANATAEDLGSGDAPKRWAA